MHVPHESLALELPRVHRRGMYVGARGRITLSSIARLGRDWALQPKCDGMYVRIVLNTAGRVAHVFSRSGAAVSKAIAGDILGAFVGWPHAELVGELEAHTEAGNRAAATRGFRLVHLFDCLHDGTRSLVSEPYQARRDALYRMQSEVVNLGCELPWYRDRQGDAHSRTDGRYVEARATDWRLAPIVDQMPVGRVEELWASVDRGDLEGVVAVNLRAPAGKRMSKAKCKPADTLDAVVVQVTPRQVVCSYGGQVFTVGRGKHSVAVGDIVACNHSGWFETVAIPRFATLRSVRTDLRGRV